MIPVEVFQRVYVGLPRSPVPTPVKVVVYAAEEVVPNRAAAAYVIRCPLVDVDEPVDAATEALIGVTMRALRKRFNAGVPVMFVCGPGLNRSTLLAALLVRQCSGFGAEGIIKQFQSKLGPAAMTNLAFLQRIRKPVTKL